jgi:hypothetical protein
MASQVRFTRLDFPVAAAPTAPQPSYELAIRKISVTVRDARSARG